VQILNLGSIDPQRRTELFQGFDEGHLKHDWKRGTTV